MKLLKTQRLFLILYGKFIWKGNPIARIKKGHDYLSPEIEIIADESLETESKTKVGRLFKKWFLNYINDILVTL